MGFLIPKTPSLPPPPPAPPVPKRDDKATQQAMEEARKKQRLVARLRRGRASTILTSGQGVLGEAPISRKTLLGQ